MALRNAFADIATEATLATRLADATFTGRINTQGQKAMAASTPVVIASDQSAVPVSAASLPLPVGAATESTLATRLSESDFDTKTGGLTEAPPATDTASSGLNGRLQRVAQRLTSLIALLPAALVGGRLDTNLGAWLGSTAPTVGQKTMANSVPIVLASDQSAVPVSGGGGVQYTEGDVDTTITGTVVMWENSDDILRAVSAAEPLPVSIPIDTFGSGSLTAAAQTVEFAPAKGDTGSCAIQITGTWSGQIEFEITINGTTWIARNAHNGSDAVNATITNGAFLLASGSLLKLRVRASSWVSGTATIDFRLGIGPQGISVVGPLPTGTNPIGSVITGGLTDAQLRATPVPVSGSVTALDEDSATGASSNVTGTGASVVILAANAVRKGATVFNDSGVVAHVKLGATASATSFAVKMVDQSYYEIPFKYTGVIEGLWASGSLRATELT